MTSVRIDVAVVAAPALCAATSLLVLDRPSTVGLPVSAAFAVAPFAHDGFSANQLPGQALTR